MKRTQTGKVAVPTEGTSNNRAQTLWVEKQASNSAALNQLSPVEAQRR
jgi:hypothetical protein